MIRVHIDSQSRSQLVEDGFLLIPNFVDSEIVEIIYQSAKSCVLDVEKRAYNKPLFYIKHKAINYTFDNPHLYNPILNLFSKGLIAPVAHEVIDNPIFHMTLIQHNSHHAKEKHGIPWHQDIDPIIGPGKFYNFLFYPHDCTEEVGGISVVPGSHKSGELSQGRSYEPIAGMESLYPKQGDLLIVDGCCFHYVPQNKSNVDRISFVTRYIAPDLYGSDYLRIGVYRTGKYDYDNQQDYND